MLIKTLKTTGKVFALLLYFLLLSAVLGEISTLGSHIHQVVSEAPIFLLLFWWFYVIQKNCHSQKRRTIVALLPLTILYIAYDYYFITFNHVFRLPDVFNLVELVQVLSIWQLLLLFVLLVFPFLLVLINTDFLTKNKHIFLGVLAFLSLTVLMMMRPQAYIDWLKLLYPGDVFYNHSIVMDNGRFASTLYFEAKRQLAMQAFEEVDSSLNDRRLEENAKRVENKPDVFVVVLESYVQLEDFANIKVTNLHKPPFKKMAHSRSPVFGGQTPRAEFEVLCGVPSYALLGSNEFNLMENDNLACLPNILHQAGYQTIAGNPYKPLYFNEERAYQSLGFKEISFLKPFYGSHHTYLDMPMPKEGYPFDGDVFAKNIEYLKKRKQDFPDKPIFNYVMTVYGHNPFYLGGDRKPVLSFGNNASNMLGRALNLSHYTRQSLQKYVKQLTELSPNSIVLIVGDHLPAMPQGETTYRNAGFLNGQVDLYKTPRIYTVNGKRELDDVVPNHYDWFYYILEQLQPEPVCKVGEACLSQEELKKNYKSIMAKAIH